MIGSPGPTPAQRLTGPISWAVTHATGAMQGFRTFEQKGIVPGSTGGWPHVLVLDCSYDVPDLSRKWDNIIANASTFGRLTGAADSARRVQFWAGFQFWSR